MEKIAAPFAFLATKPGCVHAREKKTPYTNHVKFKSPQNRKTPRSRECGLNNAFQLTSGPSPKELSRKGPYYVQCVDAKAPHGTDNSRHITPPSSQCSA